MKKTISLFWPFVICVAFAALASWALPPTAKSIPAGSELTPKMERAFGKSDLGLVRDVIEYERSPKP